MNKPLPTHEEDIEAFIKKMQSNGFYYAAESQLIDHFSEYFYSGALTIMLSYGLITKDILKDGLWLLTERGKNFKSFALEKETADLQRRKLAIDVKNAERIYTTYWWTLGLAFASFVVSLILSVLRLKG